MREQGERLKDNGNVSLIRPLAGHILSIKENLTCGWLKQSCDHAQDRCLARAGRAEKRKELAMTDY
jgi:hypothetical protein